MKKLILLTCLVTSLNAYAQNNFAAIDKHAQHVQYKGNLAELTYQLTDSLDDELEKTRSIYFWISENIKYDIKKYNKKKKTKEFKCKSKEDCNAKKIKLENRIILQTLKQKKAVCAGYSLLFSKMCEMAHIESTVISGYVKTRPNQIGRMGVLDHAWNSVSIEGKTYYLDVTWASGYVSKGKDNKLESFIKERDDFYWLTPIEKLSIDHFPQRTEAIDHTSITKETYKNQAYIRTDLIPKIELQEPKSGILNPGLNDTIYFSFTTAYPIEKLQINTNLKKNPKIYTIDKKNQKVLNEKALQKQEYISFDKKDGQYKFYYIVNEESLRYIEVLFDHELSMKFLIEVKKVIFN